MILDLVDCKTFSADYMEVLRFFFPVLEADFGVRIICGVDISRGITALKRYGPTAHIINNCGHLGANHM